VSFKGVIHQKKDNMPDPSFATGWFPGTNQTGAIEIRESMEQDLAPVSLQGYNVRFSPSDEMSQNVLFTSGTAGTFTSQEAAGPMTYTYTKTGARTARIVTQSLTDANAHLIGKKYTLDLTFNSANDAYGQGTAVVQGSTVTNQVSAMAMVIGINPTNAPSSLAGTTWQAWDMTWQEQQVAVFNANGTFTVNSEPGTYTYTKTGPNTAVISGFQGNAFSASITFTSPTTGYMVSGTDKIVISWVSGGNIGIPPVPPGPGGAIIIAPPMPPGGWTPPIPVGPADGPYNYDNVHPF
jgi:hypothetical protein